MESVKLRKYHVGLSLLKLLMCFEVVLCHFGSAGDCSVWTFPFYAIKVTAVPVFMLTSFALAGNVFINSDTALLRRRIYRLVPPLVVWSAIYFCVYALIDLVAGTHIIHGAQDFIWQAVTGHRGNLNPTMWFHFDLIVLSCLAFVCFRRVGGSKQSVLIIAALMVVFGLVMQYSGWNYDLFGDLRFELKFPLGRLCETLPYAGLGLALACLLPARNPDIAQGLPWNYSRLAVLGIGFVLLFVACFPWPRVEEGFHYGGFRIMWLSLSIYCLFNVLNVDFFPVCMTRLIVFLSRYALGVYCIHRLVGSILSGGLKKLDVFVLHDFSFACVVFVLSLAACILISLLPIRIFKQIVT